MKKIYSICLGIFIYAFASAQTTVYQKTFGGAGTDPDFGIAATPDGGHVMVGYTTSFGAAVSDLLLIKLDHDANLQWSRTYGGPLLEEASKVVLTYDHGFAICGRTASYGQGGTDAFLLKTDSMGNFQWMKTFGGPGDEIMFNLRQTSDSGFLLAGSTQSFGQGIWDMMYIKTNIYGDTMWTKIIGGSAYDQGTDAEETNDSGFVLLGRTMSFGSGTTDIFFIKLNANLDTVWSRVYGSTGWDEGMKVKQTFDGGYIITGGSNSYTVGNYDGFLNKIDANGHITWSRDFFGLYPDATYDVFQLTDSGYIIMGETESFGSNHQKPASPYTVLLANDWQLPHILGTDNSNVLVIRTNSSGDTLWCKAFGGPLQDEAYSMLPAAGDGFVVGAYSRSFSGDSIDFYIIKGDSTGFSGCYEEPATPVIGTPTPVEMDAAPQIISGLFMDTVNAAQATPAVVQLDLCFNILTAVNNQAPCGSALIFPNPCTDKATLQLTDCNIQQGADILIYDIAGRLISSQLSNFSSEVMLDVKNLSPGFYNVKVTSAGKKTVPFSIKMVKE